MNPEQKQIDSLKAQGAQLHEYWKKAKSKGEKGRAAELTRQLTMLRDRISRLERAHE
jgi:hypothetical protein